MGAASMLAGRVVDDRHGPEKWKSIGKRLYRYAATMFYACYTSVS